MVSKANLTQPAYNSLGWDVPLNSNFNIVTNCFGAVTSVSVTSANVVLTTSQAQSMLIVASGLMVANFSIFLPAGVAGTYIVNNTTTGSKVLTMYVDNGSGAPAGAGVTLPAYPMAVISDGTNVAFTYAKVENNVIGTAQLVDGSVTTVKIADANVTTAKIVDANITAAKIATDAVTTAKILNANVTPAKLSQPLTRATAQNSTSGTNVDFTSIPSWVKRITIAFNGVSTNIPSGLSFMFVQIGTGGVAKTSGYAGGVSSGNNSIFTFAPGSTYPVTSSGFVVTTITSGTTISGIMTLVNITGNSWVMSCSTQFTNTSGYSFSAGSASLTGVLDMVRINASGNTFNAGSINILYE